MSPDGWQVLRAGSGPAVLAVDFTQAQVRSGPGFRKLAALLPPPHPVIGSDETRWMELAGDDPAGWLAGWSADAGAFGDGIHAVFGYCAGAALAVALAHRAGRHGAQPPVVLFDPTTVTATTLYEQFHDALDGLAGPAPDADLRAARADGRTDLAATGAGATDPRALAHLAALLSDRYAAVARPACAAARIPPAIADQLCRRLLTYLRYLVLSSTATHPPPEAAVLVLSADHQPPPTCAGHTQVRLDIGQADLLGDPAAAGVAARALAGLPLAHRS